MILVCAATRTEHDACAEGIRAAGLSSGGDFELLLVGVGPSRAARALRARLARGPRPALVMSTGFAGALTEGVPIGTWVAAESLAEWKHGALSSLPSPAPLPVSMELFSHLRCELVSSDHLVANDSPLRRLPASARPRVADMESAALAREAAALGIPLSVARVISDTPEHPLPGFLSPFTAAMAGDGARLGLIARGIGSAVADPRGVARLLSERNGFAKKIRDGFGEMARQMGGTR